MKSSTLLFGLNPSWQRVIHADSIDLGQVNRIQSAEEFASGKGINCARTMQMLGQKAVLAQFAGGATGALLVQECRRKRVLHMSADIAESTRVCTTLLAKQITEIIEPTPQVEPHEIEQFLALLQKLPENFGSESAARPLQIAVCGTSPKGILAEFWDRVFSLFTGVPLFIDAFYNLDAIIKQPVYLMRINQSELCSIYHQHCEPSSVHPHSFSEQQAVSESSLWKYAQAVMQKFGILNMVISRGEAPVLVILGHDLYTIDVPAAPKVVNTIGAGDAMMAGILSACSSLHTGSTSTRDLLQAVQYGVAVSWCRVSVMRPWHVSSTCIESAVQAIQQNTKQVPTHTVFTEWSE
jgi:fructose-1-phosphate kinase PfkB-like protein